MRPAHTLFTAPQEKTQRHNTPNKTLHTVFLHFDLITLIFMQIPGDILYYNFPLSI